MNLVVVNANIARRNKNNTFTANNTFTGPTFFGPGTADNAPINITAGTLHTSITEGDIEFYEHVFFGTQYLVRRSFMMNHGILTTDTTVSNTTTETTIYSVMQAANYFRVGKTIVIHLFGIYSTANANDTITFRLKKGATVVSTITTPGKNVSNTPFEVEFTSTVRSIGANGDFITNTHMEADNIGLSTANTSTVALNTTIDNTLVVTAQWSSASASDTLTLQQGHTDTIN